jgi:hypothetical protein
MNHEAHTINMRILRFYIKDYFRKYMRVIQHIKTSLICLVDLIRSYGFGMKYKQITNNKFAVKRVEL